MCQVSWMCNTFHYNNEFVEMSIESFQIELLACIAGGGGDTLASALVCVGHLRNYNIKM